jgi:UBX domain-containing protein 1
MQQFLQGRAPLHILNVEHNQEVDVDMDLKHDQDYVAPKKKYKPFEGRGQRLGSPTPGITTSSSSTSAPAPSSSSAAPAGTSSYQPTTVNESEPTVTLQIRLGDGTRLQSRFNTSHTIGDVYSFVNAASPNSLQRDYVLQTTFPSKELTDKSEKLGDMAEFKRGGVVVQKWK